MTLVQVQTAVRGVMPYISQCVIRGNHAQRSGGAVSVRSVTGDLVIADSVLHSNTACKQGGAAAFSSTARVTLQGSLVANNTAVLQGCAHKRAKQWAAGNGGGIFHVRAVLAFSDTSLQLHDLLHMNATRSHRTFDLQAHCAALTEGGLSSATACAVTPRDRPFLAAAVKLSLVAGLTVAVGGVRQPRAGQSGSDGRGRVHQPAGRRRHCQLDLR